MKANMLQKKKLSPRYIWLHIHYCSTAHTAPDWDVNQIISSSSSSSSFSFLIMQCIHDIPLFCVWTLVASARRASWSKMTSASDFCSSAKMWAMRTWRHGKTPMDVENPNYGPAKNWEFWWFSLHHIPGGVGSPIWKTSSRIKYLDSNIFEPVLLKSRSPAVIQLPNSF